MLSLIENIQILILGNDYLSQSHFSLFSVITCNKERQPTGIDLTALQRFPFSVPELQKPKECTRLSIHCCFKVFKPKLYQLCHVELGHNCFSGCFSSNQFLHVTSLNMKGPLVNLWHTRVSSFARSNQSGPLMTPW